jgi:hypothetical protein
MIPYDDARRLLISLLWNEDDPKLYDLAELDQNERQRLTITAAAAVIEEIICRIAYSPDDAKIGLDRLVLDCRRNIDERFTVRARRN